MVLRSLDLTTDYRYSCVLEGQDIVGHVPTQLGTGYPLAQRICVQGKIGVVGFMKVYRSSDVDRSGEARIGWTSRDRNMKAALLMYDLVYHPYYSKTSHSVLSKYVSLQVSLQQPIEAGHLASPARRTAHPEGDLVNLLHVTYTRVEVALRSVLESRTPQPWAMGVTEEVTACPHGNR